MSWTWRKPRKPVVPALFREHPRDPALPDLRVELAKRTGERDAALAQIALLQLEITRLRAQVQGGKETEHR